MKTLHLLKRAGYRVDDRVLTSREETDAFKAQHQVRTTPQAFIDGTRIGGYEDVRAHLGKTVKDPQAPSYQPVIALFSMTALTAWVLNYAVYGSLISVQAVEWFIALSKIGRALCRESLVALVADGSVM